MSPDEVVTAFCETLSGHGLEASLRYIAPECVYQNMPFPPVHGPEGVRRTLERFFRVTGPVRIETLRQCAVGPLVMNERLDRFDPPAGRAFALPVAGAFEVHDGLITAWRDYFCMRQLCVGTGLAL